MQGDPCSSVYCGSICEGMRCCGGHLWCHRCHNIWLLSLFSRYFFGFRFDFLLPLGQCDNCRSISKLCFSLSSANISFPMDRVLLMASMSPPLPINKGRATSTRCVAGLVIFSSTSSNRVSCVCLTCIQQ